MKVKCYLMSFQPFVRQQTPSYLNIIKSGTSTVFAHCPSNDFQDFQRSAQLSACSNSSNGL